MRLKKIKKNKSNQVDQVWFEECAAVDRDALDRVIKIMEKSSLLNNDIHIIQTKKTSYVELMKSKENKWW